MYHFTRLDKIYFFLIRRFCSDATHAHFLFKRAFDRRLNLIEPKSFNEKIQWMKLYDRNPLYQKLADKYAVREYVKNRVGGEYLTVLLGLYERVEDIVLDAFPERFVLKATHGSGWNIICQGRQAFDWNSSMKKMKKWLNSNYFDLGREWAYKHIPPRILCEEFLEDENGMIPKDYKFFCFSGAPLFVQVDLDRFENHTRVFYNQEWERQPFELAYPAPSYDLARPRQLEEMLFVASSLSKDIPFCRVDLYSLPKVIFGEITLYPENGQENFRPQKYDEILGGYFKLPRKED